MDRGVLRVPSGGTIYFNTKEEAEKYMEEHPWSRGSEYGVRMAGRTEFPDGIEVVTPAAVPAQSAPTPEPLCKCRFNETCEKCFPALFPDKPIPPTSAPESQPQQDAPIPDGYSELEEIANMIEECFGLPESAATVRRAEAALTQAREALRDAIAYIDGYKGGPCVPNSDKLRAALAATQPKP